MSTIYVVMSPRGTVTWKSTEHAARTKLCKTVRDFGAGPEAYTKCPGCRRELPLAVFDLDHIRAKSRYKVTNFGTTMPIVPLDALTLRQPEDARVEVRGGVVYILTGSVYKPNEQLVHASTVWENDLSNLQFLCVACNRSKGKKTWDEWNRSEDEARPLSAELPPPQVAPTARRVVAVPRTKM